MKSDYVPPKLMRLYNRIRCNRFLYYFGEFSSWEEACKASEKYGDSYQAENIINSVIAATNKVRTGEALYEQDGVAFYKENNNWELLASFFYMLSNHEHMNVCDLGGSLGSTYFRYRNLLPMERLNWNVIEQKHYVDYGIANIPEIKFHYSVEDCFSFLKDKYKTLTGGGYAILLSSVLPYLDDPYAMLDRIIKQKPEYIIIDETVFNLDDTESEKIVLQHVPASIYEATYPSHIFSRNKLVNYINNGGYEIIFDWPYREGSIPVKTTFGFKHTINRGFLFRRK